MTEEITIPPSINQSIKPKRSQIEHKTEHEQITLFGPSWERLGLVLGHFGVHLGVTSHQKQLVFIRFREHSCFGQR